jgi:YVTN family beta-propeller protein
MKCLKAAFQRGVTFFLMAAWGIFLGALPVSAPPASAEGLHAPHGASTGLAFVVNRDSNDVAVIDTRTRQIVGRFPVGESPHMAAVSPDGQFVYTTGQEDDTLTVTRLPDFHTVTKVRVGRGPEHLDVAPDGQRVYVANFEGGTLSVVDARELRETRRLAGFRHPHNITISKTGHRAYVANLGSDQVHVVDMLEQTVAHSFNAASPIRLAGLENNAARRGIVNVTLTPDGRFGYAAHGDGGEVAVIDVTADRVIKYIKTGRSPWRAFATPDGKRMLVPNLGDRTVSVIDTEKQKVAAVLPGLKDMTGINPGTDGRLAFVIGRAENAVRVLDLEANRVVKDIRVGRSPETASTTPDGRYMYVAASGSNEVWVIDTRRLAVASVISGVGRHPWAVAIAGGVNYCH